MEEERWKKSSWWGEVVTWQSAMAPTRAPIKRRKRSYYGCRLWNRWIRRGGRSECSPAQGLRALARPCVAVGGVARCGGCEIGCTGAGVAVASVAAAVGIVVGEAVAADAGAWFG